MAVVLSCGSEAVLSHNAAAAIWDIAPWPTGLVHVDRAEQARRRPGLVAHRARVERAVREGFPVTTVARTLADLASLLSLQRLNLPSSVRSGLDCST